MGRDTPYLDRPFLAKQVPEASQQAWTKPSQARPVLQPTTIPPKTHRPIDSMLLSLGLLLIQIIVGQYFEQLCVEDGMTINAILEKQTIASDMARLVLQNGGINYEAAVKWCLENFLSSANLDNAELAQQFYDAVTCRLETDMKLQNTADLS